MHISTLTEIAVAFPDGGEIPDGKYLWWTSNVIDYFAIGKMFRIIIREINPNRDRFVNANLSRQLFVIPVRSVNSFASIRVLRVLILQAIK